MPNFDGRTVIVTGGASGIGEATVRAFAQNGARVAIADRDEGRAAALAGELGPTALAVATDVSDSTSVQAAVAAVVDRWGGIDVLCNNAGFGFRGAVTQIPDDEWDRLFSVNVRGDRAAYVASKGAVSSLTRAMAVDHAPQGVRVNAVAPGTVDTPYFTGMIASAADPEALRRSLDERAALGRMAQPEEIATAILWLASDESSFATGSVLTVDGGSSIWARN